MKVEYLNWDSDFFNLKVGEISFQKRATIENHYDFDLIYVKQDIDEHVEIEGFEKTFEETKVTFSKNLSGLDNPTQPVQTIDFDHSSLQNKLLYELAYVSGEHSRFLLDPNFSKESFKKLYRIWVDNSLNKKFADKLFYTLQENTVTGFVSLKKEGTTAKIGLIAVHPNFQGKGIGRKLISDCESYCIKNGVEQLLIPTQQENRNACNFYLKLDYSVQEKIYIKHYWKKKSN